MKMYVACFQFSKKNKKKTTMYPVNIQDCGDTRESDEIGFSLLSCFLYVCVGETYSKRLYMYENNCL